MGDQIPRNTSAYCGQKLHVASGQSRGPPQRWELAQTHPGQQGVNNNASSGGCRPPGGAAPRGRTIFYSPPRGARQAPKRKKGVQKMQPLITACRPAPRHSRPIPATAGRKQQQDEEDHLPEVLNHEAERLPEAQAEDDYPKPQHLHVPPATVLTARFLRRWRPSAPKEKQLSRPRQRASTCRASL